MRWKRHTHPKTGSQSFSFMFNFFAAVVVLVVVVWLLICAWFFILFPYPLELSDNNCICQRSAAVIIQVNVFVRCGVIRRSFHFFFFLKLNFAYFSSFFCLCPFHSFPRLLVIFTMAAIFPYDCAFSILIIILFL